MATIINLNDTNPAAPAGGQNVKWQSDNSSSPQQVSAYVALGSSTTQVLYNNGGVIGGDSALLWSNSNDLLTIGETTGSGTNLFVGAPISSLSTLGKGNIDGIGSPAIISSLNVGSEAAAALSCNLEDNTTTNNLATQFNTIVLSGTATRNGIASPYYAQSFAQSSTNASTIAGYYSEGASLGVAAAYSGTVTFAVGFYADKAAQTGGSFSGTLSNCVGYYSHSQAGIASTLNAAYYAEDQGSGTKDYAFYSAGGKSLLDKLVLTGTVTSYNGIATVGNGVSPILAKSSLTSQTAAISATTIYAVPASGAGLYRVNWRAAITTAATNSSSLGGTNGFQVVYTDRNDSVVKTSNPTTPAVSAANTTATTISGSYFANCKASTNLQYSFDYASSGATSMAFDLDIYVEFLG